MTNLPPSGIGAFLGLLIFWFPLAAVTYVRYRRHHTRATRWQAHVRVLGDEGQR